MSQILCITLMISNSFFFSFIYHPMNMGIMLLLQTMMMCVLMSLMSYSSWFSYILFLVFLGGMLVLFIYMTSIASNEIFSKSNYLMMLPLMMMIAGSIIMMIIDPYLSTSSSIEIMIVNHKNKMIMSPLYNKPTSMITMFMVIYLLLTLIVIVAITKFNKGPLRPTN